MWQGKKADVFLFLTSGFVVFIFSDSWYCQIQTTRLIMFFRFENDYKEIYNYLDKPPTWICDFFLPGAGSLIGILMVSS